MQRRQRRVAQPQRKEAQKRQSRPPVSYTHLDVYKRQPIAGLVITYVLCVELISMVTEKNNMHDIETFMFFKWIFKTFVAVFIVTNTFNITMAVFDMAQHIVSGAAGVIGGDTNIDVAEAPVSYTHLDVYKRQRIPCRS